jgi:hypothetical protein
MKIDNELDRLLEEIREEVWATRHLTGRPTLDDRVTEALRQVPRHEFVPAELQFGAYANHPLPIGHGQTISQPYIVALMTDLIRPRPDAVVLEIGTGSGYQAAVLSRLVKRVSMESSSLPRPVLAALGYDNVGNCWLCMTITVTAAQADSTGPDRATQARRHPRHAGRCPACRAGTDSRPQAGQRHDRGDTRTASGLRTPDRNKGRLSHTPVSSLYHHE